MKRAAAAVVALAFAASACGRPEAPGVRHPGTYTYLSIGDAESLDPAWARDTASQSLILQMYENLVSYRGASLTEFEPRAAERFSVSPDGLTYRFAIRSGMRFHDGTRADAEDARYSILRFCLQDRLGGPSAYLLEPLAGRRSTRKNGEPDPAVYDALAKAVRVEDGELVIRLDRPYPPLLGILATWAPLVSRRWAAAHGGWDGRRETWSRYNAPELQDSPFFDESMGSGPFTLERWDKAKKRVILKRFEDYWRGPAALERAVIQAEPEFSTRRLMLAAGDADSIYAERTEFTELASLPGVEIIDDLPTAAMNPVVFFTFRLETDGGPYAGSGRLDGEGIPPDFFEDKDARLGFAFSVDYDAFLRDVSKGKAVRARGPIPRTVLGYAPELPLRQFDLERAKAHFRKALGGAVWEKGFRLSVGYNSGNEPRGVLARMIKRNVESLNPKFRVDVRPVLWPTYLAALNARKMPVFIIGWIGSYPDADAYASPLLRSGEFFPRMQGFSDPVLDRMIDAARRETDPHARLALYRRLQRRAHERVAQLYVQDELVFRAQRSWVKGYRYHPMFPAAPHFSELYGLSKELPEK